MGLQYIDKIEQHSGCVLRKFSTNIRDTYLWLCVQCVGRHHDRSGFMHFIFVLDRRFWWMTNDKLSVRIAISHMCS